MKRKAEEWEMKFFKFFKRKKKKRIKLEKLNQEELFLLKNILDKVINEVHGPLIPVTTSFFRPEVPERKSSLVPPAPKRSSSLNWRLKNA